MNAGFWWGVLAGFVVVNLPALVVFVLACRRAPVVDEVDLWDAH